MEVLAELGLLERFLALPHQKLKYVEGEFGDERVRVGDFTHLPTRAKFIAMLPQWDFLDFLASEGKRFATFRLMMGAEAKELLRAGERTVGLAATTPSGPLAIQADLVIGADGRHSRLRDSAGLPVEDLGAPMDVLWFRLAHREGEQHAALGRLTAGQALVMLDRGDYWQCALIIRKGAAAAVKAEGLAAFRARVARLARRESVDEIQSLDDVKLLTVAVDRLTEWCRPGLLFIGDAAHAMSPIGGVGINLAIQDAVAAANILAGPLRRRAVTLADLQRVQNRRLFPTRATQALQVMIQNRVIDPMLRSGTAPEVPAVVRLAQRWPLLQRIPARVIGMGFRPEHVRTSEAP
jgi:2-polyprenyl-6-methoxyphenol hydroxylase-like FAD-dependent oxidoreductase